ncbi:E3 ubiquitin-protein ligase TRIM33 isoform X2 [Chrysoperla carnea]|uniref:E3 ubiquitin-protein ligase TRIM33 isoform X2 n=1 Tax=Chrysoperla carnea TaxID=189513 RepID=UPI001D068753|nr:E3 ubiquitin-protein ligase TRIM33 isoform X2 [Chrysoperla carnea]
MEGLVTPTSILGMDTDLASVMVKEEIVDPLEILPDPLAVPNNPEEITANASSESVVESPTTGDFLKVWNSKCVFCDRIPQTSDEPKLLECLHSACTACINSQCEQTNETTESNDSMVVLCKLCDMRSTISQIIENQFLLELNSAEAETTAESEKVVAEIKCSSCSDEAIATSWCVNCEEYICDNCVQAHQRLKITKDHTIKPKDESSNSNSGTSVPKSMFCSLHSHERLSLFCVSCDKLTCRDCQLTEHRDHKYKFIHEIAEETRASMAILLKDVSYKRVLLSSAMKVIDDRQKLIQDKKNSLVKEITQMVVRLTNTINVRGKQLVMRLNEVCDSKQKTLNEKREALDQLSMLTDHCVGFTQHALDRGSDMALLHSKRHVLSHLNRIKSRRADIPNPEIPVRIHLALDKVPDLIKVVSSIGAIVVDGKIYPSTNSGNNSGSGPHQSPSPQALPAVSPQATITPINGPQTGPPGTPIGQVPLHPLTQVFGQNRPAGQQMMQQRPPQHSMQNQQRTPPSIVPRLPYHPNVQQAPAGQQQQVVIRLPGTNNQQVTSSTHPQGINQGMADGLNQNLRGLLQTAPTAYVANNQATFTPQNPQNIYRIQTQQTIQQGYRQPPPSYTNFQQPGIPQRPQIKFQQNPQQVQNYYPQQMHQVQQHPQNQQAMNAANQQQLHRMMTPNQQQIMVANSIAARQMSQRGPSPMMNQVAAAAYQQQQQGVNNQQQQNQMNQYLQQRQGPQQQQPHVQQQQPHMQQMQQVQVQQTTGGAQWHIPQQAMNGQAMNNQQYNSNDQNFQKNSLNNNAKPDDSFKITLKNLTPRPSPDTAAKTGAVSSTIPKTPSPNTTHGGKHDDAERKLDKFCQDSVNDLMATIAKLDSNGVQVLAENRTKGGSPHVDSSTDTRNGSATNERRPSLNNNVQSTLIKNPMAEVEKDDPNEDWCAVCMDGGELVCCDKCPKVFHQYCHIPNLSVEESDTWQCLLCMNFADVPNTALGEKREPGLSPKERKIAERIVLELYCQYEPSLPFRELVSPENTDYHTKIKKPMALEVIRQKLDWNSSDHYTEIIQLITDLRLMFRNAYNYNERGTQVYNDAQRLEEFLDQQLEKWLPAYAYEDPLRDDEDKLYPPLKRYKRIVSE